MFKIFLALRGDDTLHDWNKQNEQERELIGAEGTVNQLEKYLHGVDDSANGLVRVLGGMFGAGVIARIVRGYTFISRHFKPGDKIVLVGFSRGAYTARALGGLIASQGLLNSATVDLKDKELAGVSIAKSPQLPGKSVRRQLHSPGSSASMARPQRRVRPRPLQPAVCAAAVRCVAP